HIKILFYVTSVTDIVLRKVLYFEFGDRKHVKKTNVIMLTLNVKKRFAVIQNGHKDLITKKKIKKKRKTIKQRFTKLVKGSDPFCIINNIILYCFTIMLWEICFSGAIYLEIVFFQSSIIVIVIIVFFFKLSYFNVSPHSIFFKKTKPLLFKLPFH
ncbi:hypothetical protein RFI_16541, partial [Reticulomyxa filosa]